MGFHILLSVLGILFGWRLTVKVEQRQVLMSDVEVVGTRTSELRI